MAKPLMRCLAVIPIRITRITRITTVRRVPGHLYFSTSATTPLAIIAVFGVDMMATAVGTALASGGVAVIVNFRIADG